MSEYPTYLVHYGIEGQKWGVRRFQNEDGTYTEEGLKRREKGHFISEQRNTNKAFDKITSKMQRNQEKGKRVSDKKYNKQYNKAVELGTKHRALEYISQNPRKKHWKRDEDWYLMNFTNSSLLLKSSKLIKVKRKTAM